MVRGAPRLIAWPCRARLELEARPKSSLSVLVLMDVALSHLPMSHSDVSTACYGHLKRSKRCT